MDWDFGFIYRNLNRGEGMAIIMIGVMFWDWNLGIGFFDWRLGLELVIRIRDWNFLLQIWDRHWD